LDLKGTVSVDLQHAATEASRASRPQTCKNIKKVSADVVDPILNANLNFVVQNYWQNVEIFHAAERQGQNINNGRQGSSGYKRPAPLEFSTSEDKPNVPAYIGTDMVHCSL
jgi:hypothetical protein